MIEYRKGNLFDAPKGAILAHACNTKGAWGSGIAAQFRKLFPLEYKQYQDECRQWGYALLGRAFLTGRVACLFTSEGYGQDVDSVESILKATKTAIHDLLWLTEGDIHMPKINSGLFLTPWEKTERVILDAMKVYYDQKSITRKIIVWEL